MLDPVEENDFGSKNLEVSKNWDTTDILWINFNIFSLSFHIFHQADILSRDKRKIEFDLLTDSNVLFIWWKFQNKQIRKNCDERLPSTFQQKRKGNNKM